MVLDTASSSVDYDQEAYPNTPDEARVFRWTGWKCFPMSLLRAEDSRELAPPVYYGGSGQSWA